MKIAFVTFLLVLAVAMSSEREVGAFSGDVFALFPVETDFQVELLWPEGKRPAAYLIVNLTRFDELDDDDRKREFKLIDNAVAKYKNGDRLLYVRRVFYAPKPGKATDKSDETNKMVVAELSKIGQRHFDKAIFPMIGQIEDDFWKSLHRLEETKTPPDLIAASETPIVKKSIRVTPVLTPLSRLLLDGVDCKVEFKGTLTQADGFFTRDHVATTREILDTVKVPKTETLSIDPKGLLVRKQWKKEFMQASKTFAKELGFKRGLVAYSPNEIQRIESLGLVGKQVPDFSLEDFRTRKMLQLAEFIKDRPAVISFWGVT